MADLPSAGQYPMPWDTSSVLFYKVLALHLGFPT